LLAAGLDGGNTLQFAQRQIGSESVRGRFIKLEFIALFRWGMQGRLLTARAVEYYVFALGFGEFEKSYRCGRLIIAPTITSTN